VQPLFRWVSFSLRLISRWQGRQLAQRLRNEPGHAQRLPRLPAVAPIA
jgi:hypothetical protein